MTKNNAHKKNVRERMAQHNESYAVALRKIEANTKPEITIFPLGEDSEQYIIQNVTDFDQSLQIIREWLQEVTPEDNWFTMWEPWFKEANHIVRNDWFWVPLNEDYPDDESILCNVTQSPDKHKTQTLFTGIYVSI
jgi:hypothetical protein